MLPVRNQENDWSPASRLLISRTQSLEASETLALQSGKISRLDSLLYGFGKSFHLTMPLLNSYGCVFR
jgi:hypothetical protein